MKRILIIGLTLIISSSVFAGNISDRITKLDWDGIEVVWLEDNRFPTYDVIFYFADGALSDGNYLKGETSSMFSMLGNGTRRFSQKDLSDHLEYFDTIVVSVSEEEQFLIRENAEARQINLRYLGDSEIQISLDETVSNEDVNELLSLFQVSFVESTEENIPKNLSLSKISSNF